MAGSAVLLGSARPGGLSFLPADAAFLKNLKSLSLGAGETQDNVAVELVVEAENEEVARNLVAIGQGLLAWSAFQGDKSGANKWLQAISTTQKDSFVSLRLKMPASQAIQMLKDAQGHKKARRHPVQPEAPQ